MLDYVFLIIKYIVSNFSLNVPKLNRRKCNSSIQDQGDSV